MENEKKKSSGAQMVLNALLVIVICAIFVLFIYDYVNKNNELAEYKAQDKINSAKKDIKLKKVADIANLYKDAAMSNVSEGVLPSEESEKIKKQIAVNVSKNLSPILEKVNDDQNLTNEKLDKILNELIELLEKETKKSQTIRKELAQAVKAERLKQERLQMQLNETQKVVSDLNGLVGELKAQYIAAHEEDSALGDIARAASAPAKFVTNTFTFDWFVARDKRHAQRKYDIIQRQIMEYYNAIGDPVELKRLKMKRQLKKRVKEHKKYTKIRKIKAPEPEIIK